ncbi:hypothetical protein BT93_B0817 [Corymbia citriodora subsp. variegata]|nr:hypothetical protein BT93_B0817 [Corymbia citriodora subsp. variegata]
MGQNELNLSIIKEPHFKNLHKVRNTRLTVWYQFLSRKESSDVTKANLVKPHCLQPLQSSAYISLLSSSDSHLFGSEMMVSEL